MARRRGVTMAIPPLSVCDIVAVHHARRHAFDFVRADRGAIEFVATRRTEWDGDYLAYAIASMVFWPSRRAMRSTRVLRHELCHVRQGQRLGHVWFAITYRWETWRRGYWCNRYERAARRAERRPHATRR